MAQNPATWIAAGLLAGAIARVIRPSEATLGLFGTALLGVIGAVVGGAMSTVLGVEEFVGAPAALIAAALGAAGVLSLGMFWARPPAL